jgi:hypothetical protein
MRQWPAVCAADHIGDESVALILGDNLLHGPGFSRLLQANVRDVKGCVLFAYPVSDPHRYGIAELRWMASLRRLRIPLALRLHPSGGEARPGRAANLLRGRSRVVLPR